MSGPELLTEAEWRDIWDMSGTSWPFCEWIAPYRERGLIAPEPEPKLTPEESLEQIERGIGRLYDQHRCWPGTFDIMGVIRPIFRKAIKTATESAPAASPLTREMVRSAYNRATEAWTTLDTSERFTELLHAALTEQVRP